MIVEFFFVFFWELILLYKLNIFWCILIVLFVGFFVENFFDLVLVILFFNYSYLLWKKDFKFGGLGDVLKFEVLKVIFDNNWVNYFFKNVIKL